MKKISFEQISKILPIIGIILFIYIIWNIGIDKITNAFVTIPIEYYVLASIFIVPRMLLYAVKWQYICKKQKMNFDFLYLQKIFMICMFYGTITPGAIGLHMRIFYLSKKGQASLEKCITNSIIDSATAFISGLILALLTSIIMFEAFPGLFTYLLIFLIFYLSVFVFLMKKERGNKIFKILIRPLIPKKYKDVMYKSVESFYEDLPRMRDMSIPLILEMIIMILGAIQVIIIAQAFSINVPLLDFILISITAVVVASSLPITIGGIGVREFTFVALLSTYGVLPETAFVISLSGYIVKSLFPSIVGGAILLKK